ncbi:MAG: hypothetical protein PHO23_00015 [Candidatus Pacebacteria bacterium]|nr:hypothetical protein [Candidatus Paceibacterota bacterium]
MDPKLTNEEIISFWEKLFQKAMNEASGMSWEEWDKEEANRCDYFLPSQLNYIIR